MVGSQGTFKDHPLHGDNAAATAIVALHVTMMDSTQVTDPISTTWLNHIKIINKDKFRGHRVEIISIGHIKI